MRGLKQGYTPLDPFGVISTALSVAGLGSFAVQVDITTFTEVTGYQPYGVFAICG